MNRTGLSIASAGRIVSALSLTLVLLAGQAQAGNALDATCAGKPDLPWNEQVDACTKAIDAGRYAGKDLAKALTFRAQALAQTGDLDRSLADLEQVIRLDPDDAFAFGARGDLYLVKKDYPQALADYTKATALAPDNDLAFVGRGMVYLATGELDRATAEFEQAIRLQPASAAGLYWRGIARRQKGEAAAGDADIAAAKKIDPGIDR